LHEDPKIGNNEKIFRFVHAREGDDEGDEECGGDAEEARHGETEMNKISWEVEEGWDREGERKCSTEQLRS